MNDAIEQVEAEPKKHKAKGTSPTQRTLDRLRKQGLTAQVVERWNQHANGGHGGRVDLFGCIDIIVITPSGILGIQATAGSGHAARRTKTLLEPRIAEWIKAGARFEIWSWSKRGRFWEARVEDLGAAVLAHAAHVETKGTDA